MGRTVGPCFFHWTTTTNAVYLEMLQIFVFQQIAAEADGLFFQQDSAPTHFGAMVPSPLDDRFPGR